MSSHEEYTARVITHFGHEILICTQQGERIRAKVRQDVPSLVTGDKVIWQKTTTDDAVITAIMERHGLLSRSTRYSDSKPVAANIDQVLVVCSTQPELKTGLIDRYLATCEIAKLDVMLVFNKTDLLDEVTKASIVNKLAIYETIPYQVHYISAKQTETLNKLKQCLLNKSSILVGQSGVGKSSIIRALLPHETPKIGDVSDKTNKGKHTTTHSELYQIDEESYIIDSPGIREFGLDITDSSLLETGFKEFQPYLGQCQFRDCRHLSEPKCAIQQAVKSGKISKVRWQSYKTLFESINSKSS